MLRHPRQWQEKRDVFIPECSSGWAHRVPAAGAGHHTAFRKRNRVSPSKMAPSLETKPQPEPPSGPGSPHSPPTWHRGRWQGLGVGPRLAAPPSSASCHKMVVPRHSLWRADKGPQQAAYEETPWPEGRGGQWEEPVENWERETESGRRQAHLLQNRLSQLPKKSQRGAVCDSRGGSRTNVLWETQSGWCAHRPRGCHIIKNKGPTTAPGALFAPRNSYISPRESTKTTKA